MNLGPCSGMNEAFLYYIWEHKLFLTSELRTTDGEDISVIDIGRRNRDAGPDFFNAKIKIGSTVWAGNVEMHLKSSDWYRHGHEKDKNYDNVILHVVLSADRQVVRSDGQDVKQCVLPYPKQLEEHYDELMESNLPIRCAEKLGEVPSLFLTSWKDSLLVERLEDKSAYIEQLLQANKRNWEEAFYVTLARNFGFHTNSMAFELTALSLPLSCISKHRNNLKQVEALLFGQANLLYDEKDEYAQALLKEYEFLASKFDLKPIKEGMWKNHRLRPSNSPYVRIAQFAALLYYSQRLFSKLLECGHVNEMYALFETKPSEYWKTHYNFGEAGDVHTKVVGKSSLRIIIMNTVIPFLFYYGKCHSNDAMMDKAVIFFRQLPAEDNHIIKQWKQVGLKADNAGDSQALLQLWHHYCEKKNCLKCRIGHKILVVR